MSTTSYGYNPLVNSPVIDTKLGGSGQLNNLAKVLAAKHRVLMKIELYRDLARVGMDVEKIKKYIDGMDDLFKAQDVINGEGDTR